MKKLIIILVSTIIPCVVMAQDINDKPKKSESNKQATKEAEENTIEKSIAVPVPSTKSTTPVEVEINAVEEKPHKTDNPKN